MLVENIKGQKTERTAGIYNSDEETLLITKAALKNLASGSRGNEQTKNVAQASENAAPLHDLTPSNIGMGGRADGYQQSSSLHEDVVRKVSRKLRDSSN